MESISINNLDSAIKEMLEEYSNDISDDVKVITHKVADNFKKNTQKDAPRGHRKKFYKHISIEKNETLHGAVDKWYVKDPEYRLTHLIKNGHQTKNGGRTKANDFIDKNYEIAENELESMIVEVVQGGY